jgi:hypothetical protein
MLQIARAFTLLLLCLCQINMAQAGVFRHDVSRERYLELAKSSQFDCVGRIIDHENGKSVGSCVFVGGKYAVSAAHIFITSESKPSTSFHQGASVTVYERTNERLANVKSWSVHFGYDNYDIKRVTIFPNYLDSQTKGTCDLALVEFEEQVNNTIPAKICSDYNELHAEVVGVGYGASGSANKPSSVDLWFEKIAGENIIDTIQGPLYNNKPTVLMFDLDSPQPSEKSNVMGSATPRELEYGVAGGDSGGGLFRKTQAGWELVGIITGHTLDIGKLLSIGYYGQISKSTRLSPFADWIKEHTYP